ncbi:nitrogen fixation protein NifQ [bacterium]|nr:nitrogen fixation protein NifQ [bacterium]MBU1993513.1 nitrogen fixation protein NifQ [bacterium]
MNREHKKLYENINALLGLYALNGYVKYILAPHVARVSLEMNHMYEDLGFKSRAEMGRFMMKNFPKLAMQKPKDKLWKKFLYDSIGGVAPACGNCDDKETCFGCMASEMGA